MRNGLVLTALLTFSGPFLSAGTVVGSNDGGNCYPFSCFASDGGTLYQEVYSSSAFSSPITITNLTFYQAPGFGGSMDDAYYTIDLSTTPSNVGDGYPLTVGADDQVFGTFHVSGNMPTQLTFTGTPFNYNPSNGNLLMQVTVGTVNSTVGYSSFFEADYTGSVVSRAWNEGAGPGSGTGALVTGFNVASTPEPASFGLLACGLGALTAMLRRRKA